jgi:thymidylate synthase
MRYGVKQQSRNGAVLVMPCPVVTATERPAERVLFSAQRNANPYFHLYEAVWMLAGRNDSAPLNSFIKGFGSRYGEEDGTVHGAYGHRWRDAFGVDQLNFVVNKLKADNTTRQCVIQMWDCSPLHSDLTGEWRDRPCNDLIFLQIHGRRLDLSVMCRSNDMIWGCHGANAVHFSVLHEYLAARIGAKLGTMYQWSNNYHAYLTELNRLTQTQADLSDDRYVTGKVKPLPMFDQPEKIDEDIERFMDLYEGRTFPQGVYANYWFEGVMGMAMASHHHYKIGQLDRAQWYASQIAATDWRVACCEWLERIAQRRAEKDDQQRAGL